MVHTAMTTLIHPTHRHRDRHREREKEREREEERKIHPGGVEETLEKILYREKRLHIP